MPPAPLALTVVSWTGVSRRLAAVADAGVPLDADPFGVGFAWLETAALRLE